MRPEKPTCRGFADAVLETSKGVWVMEFKFNRSAASAIRQIRQRGYGDAYRQDSRPITLVGIKFDPKRKNIDIPKFETL